MRFKIIFLQKDIVTVKFWRHFWNCFGIVLIQITTEKIIFLFVTDAP